MKNLVAVFLYLFSFVVNAQSQGAEGTDIARIVAPSPQASQFQKYTDYPVDLSTGIPNITIPIYEIKTGKLTLPISLSYHASGFKPSDESGIVGLGWVLNAGGRISRVLQGDADESSPYPQPYKTASQIDVNNISDRTYIFNLDLDAAFGWGGAKDAEYDIFNYTLSTGSGKFLLKNIGNGQRVPITLPYRPLKITSNSINFNSQFDFFEIADEQGNIYRFGKALSGVNEIEETYPSNKDGNFYRSSWMLTEIISYDKSDTIKFIYYNRIYASKSTRSDQFVVEDLGVQLYTGSCTPSYPWDCPGAPSNSSYNTYTTFNSSTHFYCEIKEIQFKHGKVVFEYKNAPGPDQQLDKIKVLDINSALVQSYKFNQAFYPNSTKYSKLDKLQILNSSSTEVSNFSFTYNPVPSGNTVPNAPLYNTGIDYWGFYNGKTSNTNLLPAWGISTSDAHTWYAGSANRESDENAAKTYMLNEIIYPTKGKTQFIYEGNRISTKVVGGLRIKSIMNNDGINNNTVKTYVYGNTFGATTNGFGNLQIVPDPAYFFQIEKKLVRCGQCGPPPPGAFYTRIQIYNSSFIDGSGIFENYPIYYPYVTEYIGTELNNVGKTSYIFEEPVNAYSASPILRYLSSVQFWKGNNLLERHMYNNINGTYNWVRKEINLYLKRQTESLQGMKVFGTFYGMRSGEYNLYTEASEYSLDISQNGYRFFDYTITSGISLLSKKTTTDYSSLGSTLVTIQDFEYSNFHNEPIKITTTNSKMEQVVSQNKYPPDITLTGYQEDARIKLVARNNIRNILEKKVTVNGVQKVLTKNNFKDFGSGIPLPESVETQNGSSLLEKRVVFEGYNSSGNLIQQSKVNNFKNAYLWGYKNIYHIAEVANAKSNEIFHDSYEEGLVLDDHMVYDKTVQHTGTTSGRIDKPTAGELFAHSTTWLNVSFTTPTKFKYSGWVYSNGPSVELLLFMYRAGETGYFTYVDLVFTSVTGKWVFIEKEFTVPADVVQLNLRVDNNGGGTVWVDDLRLHPSDALMTTYTYNPLIGMTSQSDINNRVTYYEYDSYNRLILIRDHDKNVLKKICYKYNGQTTDCDFLIYAKVKAENVTYSGNYAYADVVVRFYSDPAYTIPMVVNNLTVNFKQDYYQGGPDTHTMTYFPQLCNSSAVTIRNQILLYYSDSDSGENNSFFLQPGNGYTYSTQYTWPN